MPSAGFVIAAAAWLAGSAGQGSTPDRTLAGPRVSHARIALTRGTVWPDLLRVQQLPERVVGGVSYVGQKAPRVSAIVAWDNLGPASVRSGVLPCPADPASHAAAAITKPALGMSADY